MSSLTVLNDYLFEFASFRASAKRAAIEESVWKDFGKTGVVCVIDMCGFTKASQENGIIYYLSMVRRMQIIVEPIIQENKGAVVKFEADNCFARFDTVEQALDAIKHIFIAIKATNRTTPEDLDIDLSVGIDFGKYLLLKGNDYWGDPVNRASKLGEDIADDNIIMLTDTAWQQVINKKKYETVVHEYEISDVKISSYEIVKFRQ